MKLIKTDKNLLEKRIQVLEMEIKKLKKEVKKLKKDKNFKNFSDLYGIWEKYGDIPLKKIKEAQIKFKSIK